MNLDKKQSKEFVKKMIKTQNRKPNDIELSLINSINNLNDGLMMERKKWADEKQELEDNIKKFEERLVRIANSDWNNELRKKIEAFKKDLIKKIREERKGEFDTNRDWYYALKWCENLIQSPNINNTGDCPLPKDIGNKVKGEKG